MAIMMALTRYALMLTESIQLRSKESNMASLLWRGWLEEALRGGNGTTGAISRKGYHDFALA